jgi:Ca2+-transporting ATPase
MVFMGTALTKGSGRGIVTATGLGTELGKISVLVEKAGQDKTPIEKNLDRLGQRLIWVTLLLASAVIIGGVLTGRDVLLMIKTGIALAVAAIPEGLPVVATIALARGMLRMARRNALVNRLGAVETLGAANVICTDKTGTLTENKMTVEAIVTDGGRVEFTGEDGKFLIDGQVSDSITDEAAVRVIETGVLCSRARLGGKGPGNGGDMGDPLEIALLRAGAQAGIDRDALLSVYPESGVDAFDTLVNMMATFHASGGGFRVAVKGAPDAGSRAATYPYSHGETLRKIEKYWHARTTSRRSGGSSARRENRDRPRNKAVQKPHPPDSCASSTRPRYQEAIRSASGPA